ncbi:MAG: hypothetical protein JSS63_13370 [Bacteroidetes bacterium]|nr:hypothetical protein [Bacteroidota bacterium]
MVAKTSNISLLKIFLTDAVILALVYFIPAFSHVSVIPVYLLDPMRILLLTGFLFSRSEPNAYLLALTIPLISTLITGHPVFYKAILISIELAANVFLFVSIFKKTSRFAPVVLLVSIILSKIIYYTLKFFFIKINLIDGALITTDLLTQGITITIVVILFSLSYKKLNPSFLLRSKNE